MRMFYPLTYTQKSIWNVECTFPNNSINNIAGTIRFKEEFDVTLITKAINLLLKNNAALRIRFSLQNGEPVQYFTVYQPYSLNVFDLREEKNYQKFFEIEDQLTEKPFSIMDADLFYLAYFQLPGESAIYLKFYHLIADAWSVKLIVDTILNYYLRLRSGEEINDGPSPSFLDYLTTEQQYLNSGQFVKSKAFWEKKVETIPEFIYLKNKPLQFSIRANRISFIISEEISSKIKNYCDERKISIFTLFVAIFSVYIHQTTSKSEIMVGTTVLNRLNHIEKNTVGMYVNTIPIRLNIDKSIDFNSYLGYISSEWKNILRHQRYPYQLILQEYRQKNQVAGDLVDVTITYQNATFTATKGFQQFKGRWHPYGHQTNSLNIHINDRESSNCFVVNLDYLIELFTAEEINGIYHHLINLLTDALNNPTKLIPELVLLSDHEKRKLLYEFNKTQVTFEPEPIIHRLFEEQVEKNPHNIAVEIGDQQITYQQLDQKANLVANFLIHELKVQPDSFIGVYLDNSIDMVIAILAVLKAGAAYVPIDILLPEERVKFIMKDSGFEILLTGKKFSGVLDKLQTECDSLQCTVFLDSKETWAIINQNYSSSRPNVPTTPNNLAYLIYTSGSTGIPKGVMVEHHALHNFLFSIYNAYDGDIGPKDNCLSLTSIAFDVSVCELFLPLTFGARLILLESSKLENINLLVNTIITKNITFAYIPPVILKDVVHLLKPFGAKFILNKLLVGVEPIQDHVLEEYLALNKSLKIINGYGPTEYTICATFYRYTGRPPEGKIVPIGKPLANSEVYLLDQNNLLVPIGASAELCISGEGLARGYLNQIELTQEKFVNNPFKPGLKMYRTGDLAEWLADDNLRFVGRMDNQVKIRGFRIELGEIESQLLKHESIKEAVAVCKTSLNREKQLYAYFVSSQKIEPLELKKYLARFLPDYMIPSFFIQLDKFPLTSNGKIDRKHLPDPPGNVFITTNYQPPRNKVEQILVKLWQESLQIEKIGVDDNFFDLGGDSLAIIKILSRTYNYDWNLNVQDIYDYPTIGEISKKINGFKRNQQISQKFAITTRVATESLHNIEFSLEKIEYQNILLTGVTGFLGAHMFHELLQKTSAKIYCVIRGKSEIEIESRFKEILRFYFGDEAMHYDPERVILLNGDISADFFGLSKATYQYLSQQIDMVFHSAALVKHYGKYFDFEKANVTGTKNIIAFSLAQRKKRLNYVSSIAVAGANMIRQRRRKAIFDENSFDIGQKYMDHVYIRSKFEAENLIFEAMNAGLEANIFRIGNLTERNRDGQFQMNFDQNLFHGLLRAFIVLGCIPNEILDYEIDLTPVDYCTQAIFQLMTLKDIYNKVFHVFNYRFIKIRDIMYVLRNLNINIKGVRSGFFEKHFRNALNNDKTKNDVSILTTDSVLKKISNRKNQVRINSEITQIYLKRIGFDWPANDSDYLLKVLKKII